VFNCFGVVTCRRTHRHGEADARICNIVANAPRNRCFLHVFKQTHVFPTYCTAYKIVLLVSIECLLIRNDTNPKSRRVCSHCMHSSCKSGCAREVITDLAISLRGLTGSNPGSRRHVGVIGSGVSAAARHRPGPTLRVYMTSIRADSSTCWC
jgi:hypothetical protein